MKSVAIVSYGFVDEARLSEMVMLPQFRKATHNMMMACAALEMALNQIKDQKQTWQKDLSLFLGTGHGEFNSTIEFLKAWAEHAHARPFVFQNSLHNSTTGFLCLFEGIQAPSCTISHHYFSGEDALDTARQFLLTGQCQIACVVGVDARTVDHLPMMTGAGFPDAQWGEGAGAIVLATDAYCERLGLNTVGRLETIETLPNLEKPIHFVQDNFDLGGFYDAHAVEALARNIASKDDAAIVLNKPNGGHSKVMWTKHV